MDEYLTALENELRSIVSSPDSAFDSYYGMFRYHLGWTDADFKETHIETGKRLRPLLCLLSCEAVGGTWRSALPVAAAIELTHNFSLIHDDIEDSSDERRGRAALWKVWGLPQGLNAGDGLFVLARLALDHLAQHGLPVPTCADVSRIFDAATLSLCHGQFLDLRFESRLDVSTPEYMQMIRGKTAALIAAATRIGAMLGTGDADIVNAFAEFGDNVGIAFQITDDILGIWGDPVLTGKSAANDILSKKKSLPAIYGLERSEELRSLYRQQHLNPAHVGRVLYLLEQVGARDYAQAQADEYKAAALAALDTSGIQNPSVDRLKETAEAMTRRER